MSTVFERCGGFAVVHRVVADFYESMLAAPRLARYFSETEMRRLMDHQAKFVAWVMDGPVTFSDEVLFQAHAGLGITHDEFREAAELLRQALERNHVAAGDVDHVMRAVMRREPLIVADPDADTPTH